MVAAGGCRGGYQGHGPKTLWVASENLAKVVPYAQPAIPEVIRNNHEPAVAAILHAPDYQREHRSALSADWAHLPIPKDRDLLERLVAAGDRVVRLLAANQDAAEVINAILSNERTAALGVLTRTDRSVLLPADLGIAISYWGGAHGRWRARNYTARNCSSKPWGGADGRSLHQRCRVLRECARGRMDLPARGLPRS
jgi:hypothetical protein